MEAAAAIMPETFTSPNLFGWLEMVAEDLDLLSFGVTAMALDPTVEQYSRMEAGLTGLTPNRVIGRPFFASVAGCMDNCLVASRFETEPGIDEVIGCVLPLRVAPTKVRLWMLTRPDARSMYLGIERG